MGSKLSDKVKDYQESEDEITQHTKEHLERHFIENYTIDPMVLAKLKERTDEQKSTDKAFYAKTFRSQKVKNMYILLLSKMGELISKGQSLELEYRDLLIDLEKEIKIRK